ncbi:hypothetical protein SAMN04515647_4134 [Cohaesibacter sp. ES.047]|uniref:hypothetical protein n=1 Tax=Cohaesibacter sp. ES.047 TaxID=1798205 RepID=UPI000BB96FE5|nr:hypothetical protein [Cohaesibacter sp. ES.047]SNY93813.1 hypothetical protein SAMN04515647_4134 [Cohaesibacter sp. ES.047]
MQKRLDKEIVIAGLARDCAHSLPGLLAQLEALADRFEKSHFIFLENDSLDDTKAVLSAFAACHDNATIEFHDRIGRKHPKRTDRLAQLRNRIIEIATDKTTNLDDAYLLLLDMDGANSTIDKDRITGYVEGDDGSWAGLFANQKTDYCDLWALRHPELCPYDIWKKVRNRPADMDKREAIDTYITAIRFTLPEDRGLIEVESAFGGLGLYRLSALEGCRYIGLDADGNEICEHVAFNHQIGEKRGKLYIDSGLINALGTEAHAPAKTKWQKKRDKFRLFLKRFF